MQAVGNAYHRVRVVQGRNVETHKEENVGCLSVAQERATWKTSESDAGEDPQVSCDEFLVA